MADSPVLRRPCSALLISMPWTTLTEPSLGLAMLKSVLQEQGVRCQVLHLCLFMLEHLRPHTYEALSRAFVLNDFLFSGVLDEEVTHVQMRSLRKHVRILLNEGLVEREHLGGEDGAIEKMLHLRNEVMPKWLGQWADEIAKGDASLIGFTCMFDQTIASVALAKLIHERAPEKLMALGGYAVRTPTAGMLVESFPWLSAVCDGEGENVILPLAEAAAGMRKLRDVPGIVYRDENGRAVETLPAKQPDLDALPSPDFSDFFADAQRLSKEYEVDVAPIDLPVENSRGCWWGQKSHCIFCGIKDDDLRYRYRRPERVLATMEELSRKHGLRYFRFTDYIMPSQYYQSLLPQLAMMGRPYKLSAEIKANMTEDRFAKIAAAGFVEVQPGIESFNTDVLKAMAKGVTGIQNVHTLVLGRRHKVRIHYNLLYGFPSDQEAQYEQILSALPKLLHLDPPVTYVPVQTTRWSPMHIRPESLGILPAKAEEGYELLFSRTMMESSGFDMDRYCYYFERSFENSPRLERIYETISEVVTAWKTLFLGKQAWLYRRQTQEGWEIHDRRASDPRVYSLSDAAASVLDACQSPILVSGLKEALSGALTPEQVDRALGELDVESLIYREGDQVLSLVLDGPPSPEDEDIKTRLPVVELAGV